MLVGAGVLLVMALYLVTVVSKQRTGGGSPAVAAATVPSQPLDATLQAQVTPLEAEIEHLTGTAQIEKQQELVNLFILGRRYDRAAAVMEAIAEARGNIQDWIYAGNLYFDWMQQQVGQARVPFAKQAIAAYQQALDLDPANLDVRTDMAVAYLDDPDNPMEAIRQTNQVLELDSTHIQANFNRGVMLMRINRFEQALAQFEHVKTLVGDPDDEVYQRAEAVIERIQQSTPGS